MDTMLRQRDASIPERAAQHRNDDPEFAGWAKGYGVIRHQEETQRSRPDRAHTADSKTVPYRLHGLLPVARLLKLPREQVLSDEELNALDGKMSSHGIIIPELYQ
jgi:hypothetical protein